jgi:hypothetical protein
VQPGGLDDKLVDLAQLSQADQLPDRPARSLLDGLRIHPLCGLRVALHLEVLRKFLATDGLPFSEELFDLLETRVFPSIAVE